MTKPMMPQMDNGSEVALPAGLRRTVVIDGEVYGMASVWDAEIVLTEGQELRIGTHARIIDETAFLMVHPVGMGRYILAAYVAHEADQRDVLKATIGVTLGMQSFTLDKFEAHIKKLLMNGNIEKSEGEFMLALVPAIQHKLAPAVAEYQSVINGKVDQTKTKGA